MEGTPAAGPPPPKKHCSKCNIATGTVAEKKYVDGIVAAAAAGELHSALRATLQSAAFQLAKRHSLACFFTGCAFPVSLACWQPAFRIFNAVYETFSASQTHELFDTAGVDSQATSSDIVNEDPSRDLVLACLQFSAAVVGLSANCHRDELGQFRAVVRLVSSTDWLLADEALAFLVALAARIPSYVPAGGGYVDVSFFREKHLMQTLRAISADIGSSLLEPLWLQLLEGSHDPVGGVATFRRQGYAVADTKPTLESRPSQATVSASVSVPPTPSSSVDAGSEDIGRIRIDLLSIKATGDDAPPNGGGLSAAADTIRPPASAVEGSRRLFLTHETSLRDPLGKSTPQSSASATRDAEGFRLLEFCRACWALQRPRARNALLLRRLRAFLLLLKLRDDDPFPPRPQASSVGACACDCEPHSCVSLMFPSRTCCCFVVVVVGVVVVVVCVCVCVCVCLFHCSWRCAQRLNARHTGLWAAKCALMMCSDGPVHHELVVVSFQVLTAWLIQCSRAGRSSVRTAIRRTGLQSASRHFSQIARIALHASTSLVQKKTWLGTPTTNDSPSAVFAPRLLLQRVQAALDLVDACLTMSAVSNLVILGSMEEQILTAMQNPNPPTAVLRLYSQFVADRLLFRILDGSQISRELQLRAITTIVEVARVQTEVLKAKLPFAGSARKPFASTIATSAEVLQITDIDAHVNLVWMIFDFLSDAMQQRTVPNLSTVLVPTTPASPGDDVGTQPQSTQDSASSAESNLSSDSRGGTETNVGAAGTSADTMTLLGNAFANVFETWRHFTPLLHGSAARLIADYMDQNFMHTPLLVRS